MGNIEKSEDDGALLKFGQYSDEKYLDPKRERFCRSIIEHSGNTEALVLAYREVYDPESDRKVALQKGTEIACYKAVRERLNYLYGNEVRLMSIGRKQDMVADMVRKYDIDVTMYFTFDEESQILSLRPFREWTADMRRACTGIKQGKNGIELSLFDKAYAFNKICAMMGYDQAEVIGQKRKLGDMDAEDLNALAEDSFLQGDASRYGAGQVEEIG